MIQNFRTAKTLYRELVKKYNIKDMTEWRIFTTSLEFKTLEGILPKRPDVYYSKKNVERRIEKKN